MNISSLHSYSSFFNFGRTSPVKKTFSQLAYSNFSVTDREAVPLGRTRFTITSGNEEASNFLQTPLNRDVQKVILQFLDKKDQRTCLRVCKQLHAIATPILDEKALSILSTDFKEFEARIDEKLADVNTLINGKKVRINYLSFFNSALEQLTSFEAYCAYLESRTTDAEQLKEIKTIMQSIIKLQKACQSDLDGANKIKTFAQSFFSLSWTKSIFSQSIWIPNVPSIISQSTSFINYVFKMFINAKSQDATSDSNDLKEPSVNQPTTE